MVLRNRLFFIKHPDLGQHGHKQNDQRNAHIQSMRPMDSFHKDHFSLYPDDQRKANVNTKRPGPIHIGKEIKELGQSPRRLLQQGIYQHQGHDSKHSKQYYPRD